MFYAAGPPRSYMVVPNTGAIAPPVISPSARETYTNQNLSPVLNRPMELRNPLDMPKSFSSGRSVFHPPANMSYSQIPSGYSSTSTSYSNEYRTGDPSEPSLPFNPQETMVDMVTSDGCAVRPEIICKIEKGFFYSLENSWTCYRRNYFSVSCSYAIEPQAEGILYIRKKSDRHDTEAKPVQALAMKLSASTDGTNSRLIDLVQHTPKRDKGPQLKVSHTKLYPVSKSNAVSTATSYSGGTYSYQNANGPLSTSLSLPLQAHTTQSNEITEAIKAGITFPPPLATNHTFERIQFKSATANNGKRRAQQQYYHLIVEMYADVRPDSSHPEEWVKVAQKVSEQVVVRGRSPSHYQNEGPNSTARATTVPLAMTSGRNTSWAPYGHTSNLYVGQPPNNRVLPGPGAYIYSSMSESAPHLQLNHLGPTGIPTMEPPRTMPANLANGRSLFSTQAGPGAADDDHGGYSYYPQAMYDSGLSSPNVAMVKQEDLAHSGKSSSSPESPAGNFSHHIGHKYTGYETSKGYYPH
jgi:meiosis-specific transcription factor NDT80